ncbi:MAG TPA: hypothetical protein VGU20_25075 [Stellaceae bacterium]|nr:hypothetical protein [Stellaceae bacterium]
MDRSRLVVVAVAAVIALSLLVIGVYAWITLGDTGMTASGYFAVALGALGTIGLGVGLMTLLFYSHRHGYDERAGESPLERERD